MSSFGLLFWQCVTHHPTLIKHWVTGTQGREVSELLIRLCRCVWSMWLCSCGAIWFSLHWNLFSGDYQKYCRYLVDIQEVLFLFQQKLLQMNSFLVCIWFFTQFLVHKSWKSALILWDAEKLWAYFCLCSQLCSKELKWMEYESCALWQRREHSTANKPLMEKQNNNEADYSCEVRTV